jgi:protein arginine N-methyltransferase 1
MGAMTRTTAEIVVAGSRVAVRTAPAGTEPFVLFPSVGEYPVYDDAVYDSFDTEDDRYRAYRAAIHAVAGGKCVLDIGTGRDALWAIEAARAGARHVYAIEAQPAAAAQARQAVIRAGSADRVSIVEGHAARVDLPERAQVCVSEIVGNIASAEGAIAVLADARRRLCSGDCVWIPYRCQTRIAAVDLSRVLAAPDYAIATESLPYLERIFAGVGRPFDVRLCVAGPVQRTLLSSTGTVESLVFPGTDHAPATGATVELVVHAPGGHLTGLLLWARVCCATDQPDLDALAGTTRGWAPVYAPISLDGVAVRAGQRIRVSFTATTSDDGVHPDYRMSVQLVTAGDARHVGDWSAPHHGPWFRAGELHRQLFPVPDPPTKRPAPLHGRWTANGSCEPDGRADPVEPDGPHDERG